MGLGNSSIRKNYYTELQNTIEALKEEKDFISDILNSIPSVLISLDKNANITRWSSNAEKAYAIKTDQAEGRRLSTVLPYLAEEEALIISSGSHPVKSGRFRKIRDDKNQHIYEEVTVFPLTGYHGEGSVLRIDNVTEHIRLQEKMVQSEKMLTIGGLAAGMAHEINNPLAGIIQTARVMTKRLSDIELTANMKAAEKAGISLEGLKKYLAERGINKMLQAINDSGKRASFVIKNMLHFSRKEEDSFSTHNPIIMMDQIIELAAIDFNLKKHFDFRNIRIIREYDRSVPEIPCSESQIQQVVLNLLRNGAEAMSEITDPAYKPHFKIKLRKEKTMLRIEIEDNGPGIGIDTQKHIFEPFYTTKQLSSGTGLGLSVSYFIIVNNHNGKIQVESEPGKGTRFIIHLPLTK
jgi:PAS domain S-box-containing protein